MTVGLVLAATTAAVGFGAPAHADTPPAPWVLYKTFGWGDACSSAGYAGEQSGKWVEYMCDELAPSSWDAPGIFDLYVVY